MEKRFPLGHFETRTGTIIGLSLILMKPPIIEIEVFDKYPVLYRFSLPRFIWTMAPPSEEERE